MTQYNKIIFLDAVKEFLNKKFEELQISVDRSIKNSKNSILYNIENKMEEIKLAIVACNTPRIPIGSAQTLFAAVDTTLPIANFDDFITFDTAVKENPEKKDALVTYLYIFLNTNNQ